MNKDRLWVGSSCAVYTNDPSLISNFSTSSIPAYEDKDDLVVPLVKFTSGSVVEHIFYGFVSRKYITIALLISVLHKQWQRHCQLCTSIYNFFWPHHMIMLITRITWCLQTELKKIEFNWISHLHNYNVKLLLANILCQFIVVSSCWKFKTCNLMSCSSPNQRAFKITPRTHSCFVSILQSISPGR